MLTEALLAAVLLQPPAHADDPVVATPATAAARPKERTPLQAWLLEARQLQRVGHGVGLTSLDDGEFQVPIYQLVTTWGTTFRLLGLGPDAALGLSPEWHVGVGFIGLATSLPVYLTARYGLDARLGSEVPFGVDIGAGLAPSAAFTYGAGAGVWVAPTVTAELGVGLPEPIFRDSAFWAMQLLKLQVRADLPAVSASDLTWEHVSAVLVWRGRFPV